MNVYLGSMEGSFENVTEKQRFNDGFLKLNIQRKNIEEIVIVTITGETG